MKKIIILFISIVLISCSSDNEMSEIRLSDVVAKYELEIDNVIACAAGGRVNQDEIIAYVYPRSGVSEIRYFETENAEVDKNEYENYKEVILPIEDFFNGYLKKIKRETTVERWIILTFVENGKLQLSNPIRLKHKTQNTNYTDAVTIDQEEPLMPLFIWNEDNANQNAIYFEVVSTTENELLSGTYTFEQQFQYYKLDNVVLNITRETPPVLQMGIPYNYTTMGVSEDNWVNIFIEKAFIP